MSQDSPDGRPGHAGGAPGRPSWPHADPFGQRGHDQHGDGITEDLPAGDPAPPYLPRPYPLPQSYGQPPHPGCLPQQPPYPPPWAGYPAGQPYSPYQQPACGQPGDPAFAAARSWAIAGYLLCFAGFIGPLIACASRRDAGPFSRFHGAQALNLALTYASYSVAAWILTVAASGNAAVAGLLFLSWLAVTAVYAGLAIGGSVSASRGRCYRIPRGLCLPLVR